MSLVVCAALYNVQNVIQAVVAALKEADSPRLTESLALLYTFTGPSRSRAHSFRLPLFAARTLNATGQARVTLSLR